MTARMMHLNLFVFGCGHHRGAWRHPNSSVERLGDIRYYEQLAQTAERGKRMRSFLPTATPWAMSRTAARGF